MINISTALFRLPDSITKISQDKSVEFESIRAEALPDSVGENLIASANERYNRLVQAKEKGEERRVQNMMRAAETHYQSEQAVLSMNVLSLEGEISLQAAKAVGIPGDLPFWLSHNWDKYEQGLPLGIQDGNVEHPQSDEIRRFLDSKPEQIAVIRTMHQRLDNYPSFEEWAVSHNLLFDTIENAESSAAIAGNLFSRAHIESEMASHRAALAAEELGRSYNGN